MGAFNCDDFAVLRDVSFVLRTNAAVANNSAHTFRVQLTAMFRDMMQIYRRCPDGVLPWIARYGADAPRFEQVRAMKCVKSAVLQVLINSTATIEHAPAILETIIQDYADSPRDARVPEVLTLLQILMDRSPDHIADSLAAVLGSVFSNTVSMINMDYETDIAFHMPLCKFLKGLVVNFLDEPEAAAPEEFKLVVDTIMWQSSHPIHDVCTLGLEIKRLLFERMAQSLRRDEFLSMYYLAFVKQLFENIVDTTHRFAIHQQIGLLAVLLVQQGDAAEPATVAQAVLELAPQRSAREMTQFVAEVMAFAIAADEAAFKRVVQDFLVTNHTFKAGDPDLLRDEIRERQRLAQDEYFTALNAEEDVVEDG
jgi:hypothetical protein